jgi:hypothetical protein
MSKDDSKIDYMQERLDSIATTCSNIDKELAIHRTAFSDHCEQEAHIYSEFKRMNDILQQNTDSLREHMHRSDMLESLVTSMDTRFSPVEIEFQRKKAISEWQRDKLMLLAKIAGVVSAAAAAWVYLKPFLAHLIQ